MKLVQHPNVVRLYEVKGKLPDQISFIGDRIHNWQIEFKGEIKSKSFMQTTCMDFFLDHFQTSSTFGQLFNSLFNSLIGRGCAVNIFEQKKDLENKSICRATPGPALPESANNSTYMIFIKGSEETMFNKIDMGWI